MAIPKRVLVDEGCALVSQMRVDATLHDAIQGLLVRILHIQSVKASRLRNAQR